MIHEYYQYSREQLLECPKIPLEVGADNEAVFRAMADEMVEEIQSRAALGRTCVFICPVGPVGQYPFFVERVNRENISLKHYMNTTWVARPLPYDMPSNEELFGEFNKPDMDEE